MANTPHATNRLLKEKRTLFSWGRIWVVVASIVVLVGIGLFGLAAYARAYHDRVLPGVTIGEVVIGGMDKAELRSFFERMADKLVNDGLHFSFVTPQTTKQFVLYPVLVINEQTVDLMRFDVDTAVEAVMAYGKDRSLIDRTTAVLKSRLSAPVVDIGGQIWVDSGRLQQELREFAADYETEPRNANVIVTAVSPLVYDVTSSSAGVVLIIKTYPGS